jgi:hypothetical protein
VPEAMAAGRSDCAGNTTYLKRDIYKYEIYIDSMTIIIFKRIYRITLRFIGRLVLILGV